MVFSKNKSLQQHWKEMEIKYYISTAIKQPLLKCKLSLHFWPCPTFTPPTTSLQSSTLHLPYLQVILSPPNHAVNPQRFKFLTFLVLNPQPHTKPRLLSINILPTITPSWTFPNILPLISHLISLSFQLLSNICFSRFSISTMFILYNVHILYRI